MSETQKSEASFLLDRIADASTGTGVRTITILKSHKHRYRVVTARDATMAERKLYMKRGK